MQRGKVLARLTGKWTTRSAHRKKEVRWLQLKSGMDKVPLAL